MDRLPLRLLAFVLGPLAARRAAGPSRTAAVSGQTLRALHPPSGNPASDAKPEADVDRSVAAMLRAARA